MNPLTPAQIKAALVRLPNWRRRGRVISRVFAFRDFAGSVGFVQRVARKADRAGHHPDVDIRWNLVTVALTTHSEKALTAKDFALAADCDAVAARLGQPARRK